MTNVVNVTEEISLAELLGIIRKHKSEDSIIINFSNKDIFKLYPTDSIKVFTDPKAVKEDDYKDFKVVGLCKKSNEDIVIHSDEIECLIIFAKNSIDKEHETISSQKNNPNLKRIVFTSAI